MGYIKRSVLGFVVGGLLFTQIQLELGRTDWKQWVLLTLAAALFGCVSAWVLQSLNDEQRRLRSWSSGGWAVAALAFLGTVQVLDPASVGATLLFVIPCAVAGLCGGVGFGIGWSGTGGAVVLGLGSAIVLPIGVWVNVRIWAALIPFLLRQAPDLLLSPQAMEFVMWTAVATGFAIFGALFGTVLGFYEAKRPSKIVILSNLPGWAEYFEDPEEVAATQEAVKSFEQELLDQEELQLPLNDR